MSGIDKNLVTPSFGAFSKSAKCRLSDVEDELIFLIFHSCQILRVSRCNILPLVFNHLSVSEKYHHYVPSSTYPIATVIKITPRFRLIGPELAKVSPN